MPNVILSAKQISKYYGSGHTEIRAVHEVSLEIVAGELVLITGPSGSGKTTLLSILGGLLSPTNGSVTVAGQHITGLRDGQLAAIRALEIGFIFQAFNLLEALTVEENILFPAQLSANGIKGAKPRAEQLMSQLSLLSRRNALPKTLSGGEKQRVAVARALINGPKLILADEPTGNLDSQTGQDVMMILHDLARDRGYSVIIVTHDPRVEEIADRILWLEDGELRDRKTEQHSWGKDPVCGMRVDEWTAKYFCTYESKRYYFCTEKCKLRFENSPKMYISSSEHRHKTLA